MPHCCSFLLSAGVAGRPLWVAASTHAGEEECVGRVHLALAKEWHNLLTIIVPRQPSRYQEVANKLTSMGLNVKFWSTEPRSCESFWFVHIVGISLLFAEYCLVCCVCGLLFLAASMLMPWSLWSWHWNMTLNGLTSSIRVVLLFRYTMCFG